MLNIFYNNSLCIFRIMAETVENYFSLADFKSQFRSTVLKILELLSKLKNIPFKVSVSDGKSRPLPSRLKLCSDYLVLQREEFHIWDDETSYPVESGLRYKHSSNNKQTVIISINVFFLKCLQFSLLYPLVFLKHLKWLKRG